MNLDEPNQLDSQLHLSLFSENLFLEKDQCTLGWLIGEFKPDQNKMDDLLLESITGYSYKTEADDQNEDRRIKHLSNINEMHEDEDT